MVEQTYPDPCLFLKTRVSVCDTRSRVSCEESGEVLRMCTCVCLSVFGVLDQSEVLFETVVRATNLLNQLPSALTDTVSFWDRHQSLYRLSLPVSFSPPADCIFVFRTHACIFLKTLIFNVKQHRFRFLSRIPFPNPFVKVSFLSVISVNRITVAVIVFQIQLSHGSQNAPAHISCAAVLGPAVSKRSCQHSLRCHSLCSRQVKICHQDME